MATEALQSPQDETLEEIDNPIERLKLLGENDDEIAKYLDAMEVTSTREREMLHEISRTRPLAHAGLFPQAHRNMAEALESLARHGYHGTGAGGSLGPLRIVIRWGVKLVAGNGRAPGAAPRPDRRRKDGRGTRDPRACRADVPHRRRVDSSLRDARTGDRASRVDPVGEFACRCRDAHRPHRLVAHPSRRRACVEAHPPGHAGAGSGSLERDRLVRQAAEGSESDVRDRLGGADARLLDPRADPRRHRVYA